MLFGASEAVGDNSRFFVGESASVGSDGSLLATGSVPMPSAVTFVVVFSMTFALPFVEAWGTSALFSRLLRGVGAASATGASVGTGAGAGTGAGVDAGAGTVAGVDAGAGVDVAFFLLLDFVGVFLGGGGLLGAACGLGARLASPVSHFVPLSAFNLIAGRELGN